MNISAKNKWILIVFSALGGFINGFLGGGGGVVVVAVQGRVPGNAPQEGRKARRCSRSTFAVGAQTQPKVRASNRLACYITVNNCQRNSVFNKGLGRLDAHLVGDVGSGRRRYFGRAAAVPSKKQRCKDYFCVGADCGRRQNVLLTAYKLRNTLLDCVAHCGPQPRDEVSNATSLRVFTLSKLPYGQLVCLVLLASPPSKRFFIIKEI